MLGHSVQAFESHCASRFRERQTARNFAFGWSCRIVTSLRSKRAADPRFCGKSRKYRGFFSKNLVVFPVFGFDKASKFKREIVVFFNR